MIRFRNLTYYYPRATEPALTELDLDAPKGQFCAVIGANGAGKSTLCYTLAGFVPHFYRGKLSGSVEVDGVDVAAASLREMAGRVGLVFSNPFNQITGARFTVEDEIAFGPENLGLPPDEIRERRSKVMEMTGLTELAERSPFALSGGQQQRLAIASVLAMMPPVLVLDEPTSQLDPVGAREVFGVLRALAAEKTTIILATHKLEWAAVFADRVLLLDHGRLVADGPPDEVLASTTLSRHGLRPTRYTLVARMAAEAGLVDPARPLPVTLDQAVAFFS